MKVLVVLVCESFSWQLSLLHCINDKFFAVNSKIFFQLTLVELFPQVQVIEAYSVPLSSLFFTSLVFS